MRVVKLKGMRQVNGLHYAPDGRRLLAVGGYEVRSLDEARWVDVVGGTETLRVPLNASCYDVSPGLSRLAVVNSRMRQWDGEPLPPVVTFDPNDATWHERLPRWQVVIFSASNVYGIAYAPDGRRLAVSYREANGEYPTDHQFIITPLSPGRAVGVPPQLDRQNDNRVIAFSPDGRLIAGSGSSLNPHIVWLINSRTADRTGSVALNHQPRQLVYSPDSSQLAVANAKRVDLFSPNPFSPNADEPRLTLTHPKQVNAVAFTPDGRRMLTTCTDKLVRVWDTATGQLVTSYDWNVGVTNAIAMAPDGLTAAVSGQTGRVVLFDLV
jgi:WD40 repeat protein